MGLVRSRYRTINFFQSAHPAPAELFSRQKRFEILAKACAVNGAHDRPPRAPLPQAERLAPLGLAINPGIEDEAVFAEFSEKLARRCHHWRDHTVDTLLAQILRNGQ